jgi:hypothetical protein
MAQPSDSRADALPCRHPPLDVDKVKRLLQELPSIAPDVLAAEGIDADAWSALLRAAVESLRGAYSATTSDKRRFVEAVLDYGVAQGLFASWSFVGTENRQDYRVDLPDETAVCLEQKGCPDGNNTNIWDRPGWADEFVVWCLCPESLVNQPGAGAWSGVSTRLLPKVYAERQLVDALIFWDGRCGSDQRRCPKRYGVEDLRDKATSIPSQQGTTNWLPPPCIYLFPRSIPHVRNNRRPPVHTPGTLKIAKALLNLFKVPEAEHARYVHLGHAEVRGVSRGTQLRIGVVSRCWPDGVDREVVGKWKTVRRE